MNDYPREGCLALHHKTIDHPDYPEDPRYIRINQKINAFLFEDILDNNGVNTGGTKLTWIVSQDIKVNIPLTLLHQRAVKNPKIMIDSLIKAC